jgi:hypothetical protein
MVQPISNLVKVAGQTVERATLTGLQNASQKSGVSFQYLVAKAAQESSLKTDAKAETSSAVGLFQFTRGTWLDMMKKYGALYGYGDLAQKISVTDDGKPVVKDPAAEQRLMGLRSNVEASALMAAEYARDNANALQGALGRGADAADLYLAHFLGANGASQLLSKAASDPDSPAADVLPAAAKANHSIFYAADGSERSAAEVVKLVRERFTGQMDRYAEVASSMIGANGLPAAPEREPAAFNDVRAAVARSEKADVSKAMISRFILEEMAKMIAVSPMTMSDGSEDEENSANDTALASVGFQGNDWAAAMGSSLTKDALPPADQAALERSLAKGRAGEANRTYEMLNAVPGAPFMPARRNDPS